MNFIVTFKKRIADFGAQQAFNRLLPFNEMETLKAASGYFKKSMNFKQIEIYSIEEDKEKFEGLEGLMRRCWKLPSLDSLVLRFPTLRLRNKACLDSAR